MDTSPTSGLVVAFSAPVSVAPPHSTRHGIGKKETNVVCTRRRQIGVRMGPWKEGEKDKAFEQQQEILARRRDKKRNEKYFENIEERRKNIQDNFEKRRLKVKEGEDPLIEWKRMKDAGLIDDSSYSESDEGGIPIPMASFGIPQYDNGARFDLRLPHVEIGYTDEDADVMAKAGRAFKNLFGLGKKDEKGKKPDSETTDDQS